MTWALPFALLALAGPSYAGSFSWLNLSGYTQPARPTATRTAAPTPQLTAAAAEVIDRPAVPLGGVVSTHAAPARVYLTDLLPTAGGWALLWLVQDGPLNSAQATTTLWYAHRGTREVPARPLIVIHRVDKEPLYTAAVSPDGTQVALTVHELIGWQRWKSSGGAGSIVHAQYGVLALDGTWRLAPSEKTVVSANLDGHGGIGHLTWTGTVVRLSVESTCSKQAHQCTYGYRIEPRTGRVLGSGQTTTTWHGHETAPQILPFDDKTAWLTTVSDIKAGGISAWRSHLGGMPVGISSPFLLDLDPRSRWNGESGMGRRLGTLWRTLRTNDHKLNAANEPWAMQFVTWDLVPTRPGSSLVRPVILSRTQLTDWSTLPAYRYGSPVNSRWNTGLEHLPGGGWAVGFQDDGSYTVGTLTEAGEWQTRERVGTACDYAGDVAVRGDRVGYVTTDCTADGVSVVVGER